MPPRADGAVARVLGASGFVERAGTYAELSKFGIVLLVLVSAAAGFMLRAPLGADFPWGHGLVVLLGVMLLSSGASALNQVQERDRDALMARTAGRPLPSGRITHAQGLAFAMVATTAGAVVLWVGIGRTAGILGLIAAVFYNAVYTPWLKPTSAFAAVPGAIPGSIPPVIGWVAAGGGLTDAGAIILFGILFLWQMPHFWALALRYRADYASGGFPMVSRVVAGRAHLRRGRTSLVRPRRPARWAAHVARHQVRPRAPRSARLAVTLPLLELLPPPAFRRDGRRTSSLAPPQVMGVRSCIPASGNGGQVLHSCIDARPQCICECSQCRNARPDPARQCRNARPDPLPFGILGSLRL